jgi:hypothetical protein
VPVTDRMKPVAIWRNVVLPQPDGHDLLMDEPFAAIDCDGYSAPRSSRACARSSGLSGAYKRVDIWDSLPP